MTNPERPSPRPWLRSANGYTLVELLIVLTIILLVSAATLPVIMPAMRQRQVNEAARIFQAALAGARDLAISKNAPRGIRLLPDPLLTQPVVGSTDSNGNNIGGAITWACNRFVPIEPASDYSEGRVTFFDANWSSGQYTQWFLDPNYQDVAAKYSPLASTNGTSVLMLLQSFIEPGVSNISTTVELTSWAWNLRVGDKIQIANPQNASQPITPGTGNVYTIIGPVVDPNPDNYINYGANGPPSPSNYVNPPPEYLLLVNGVDDDGDGLVDNPFNGVSLNTNYEPEKWLGAQVQESYSHYDGFAPAKPSIRRYVAKRRPVPARGARETLFPANVVVDLTTWNLTQERSRIPVDGDARYIDILLDPSGQVIQSTRYSNPANFISPFLHFWLTDREGVVEPPYTVNTDGTFTFQSLLSTGTVYLPMPSGTSGYAPTNGQTLQGERMLLTIFAKTGNITTNSLQNFDGTDINAPFYAAQRGERETP